MTPTLRRSSHHPDDDRSLDPDCILDVDHSTLGHARLGNRNRCPAGDARSHRHNGPVAAQTCLQQGIEFILHFFFFLRQLCFPTSLLFLQASVRMLGSLVHNEQVHVLQILAIGLLT